MNRFSAGLRRVGTAVGAVGIFWLAGTAAAQVVIAPTTPQIGSSQPATAYPRVPRPSTTPCVVHLFDNLEFADFTAKTFNYLPPSGCPGPWAKVVFTADFTVTEGRQYDRTASFYLGHANIYYGTTAEPSATVSPSWHVERDVTDLSAIFKTMQTGEADLGNFVGTSGGVVYNGIIYADAALEFYPRSLLNPAPVVPEVVVPMPDAEGGATALSTTDSRLTQSIMLPTNVERLYLDVIMQSQSNDEFWYTCAPNDVAGELFDCGNSPFREGEIFIDGQPAGVAPVYPWIYTGGIDPYLWRPIPDIQTYEFVPYRVDLTPFAGVVADGHTHTVALQVFNADSYFLTTANLLAYTDHGRATVTGGLLSNNLTAEPTPVVNEKLTTDSSGNITGAVTVTSDRNYTISGYVNTSHGRVDNTASQIVQFSNTQTYNITSSVYVQNIQQSTTASVRSTAQSGPVRQDELKRFTYPLALSYAQGTNPDSSIYQTTKVNQSYLVRDQQLLNGFSIFERDIVDEVKSADTLNFNSSGALTGTANRSSSQWYFDFNSLGYCYSRMIDSSAGLLSSLENGVGCPQH